MGSFFDKAKSILPGQNEMQIVSSSYYCACSMEATLNCLFCEVISFLIYLVTWSILVVSCIFSMHVLSWDGSAHVPLSISLRSFDIGSSFGGLTSQVHATY